MYITKRIVMITREVKFAIDAKNALERNGEFAITTFTSAKAAVDFVRQNAQDLAIIDFRVRDMSGPDVIDHMRALQPDLAIVAAPDHQAVRDLQKKYNIQEFINLPHPIRKLPGILYSAIQQMYEAQPETRESSPVNEDSASFRPAHSRTIEFWVSDSPEGEAELQFISAPEVPEPEEPTSTFAKLAAEEPPMPGFEEGSTLHDLHERLVNPENLRRIIQSLTEEDHSPALLAKRDEADEVKEDSHAIPAALILETALDESTPIRIFSISEFMTRVHERGMGSIEPLPSWLDEGERYVREPEFLPEQLPDLDEPVEYTATPTVLGSAQSIEPEPGELVTDPLVPIRRSHPAEEMPAPESQPEISASAVEAVPQELDAAELEDHEAEDHAAAFVPPAPPSLPELPELPEAAPAPAGFAYTHVEEGSPEVAQLAVMLTQVSLELTAEATLLTRDGRIVAYAGNLPTEDIHDLREELGDDWEGQANKSRIRFVTLSSSGSDYMLFTRKTEAGFTLSMIFAGNRPLHEIRRQGQRLADALAVVPEMPAEALPEPVSPPPALIEPAIILPQPEDIGERSPYTCVWVLRDPEASINDDAARAIVRRLDVELAQAGWQVHDLNVHEDFVYLHGDMPVRLAVHHVVKDLMRSSAAVFAGQKMSSDPNTLWDSGYLVLQPGRSMEMDEIQRFVNFLRQ